MEKTLFHNLKSIFAQYRFRFFASFLMVVISNALLILNPLILRQAVLAMQPIGGLPSENFLKRLIDFLLGTKSNSVLAWVILLLLVAFLASCFKYYMRIGFISISRDVEKELRLKIFEKVQRQSRAFYDNHGIGELLSRLTNDISAYRDVLGPGIMYPIFYGTLLIPGLLALFSISKTLTLVAVIPLLLIPLINAAVRREIYRLSLQVQQTLGTLSNQVQEHFSAIRIIKSYVIESAIFQNFKKLCAHMARLNVRLNILQGLLLPLFQLLTKLVPVILLLFFSFLVFRAHSDLNAADFVAFMWIQSYVFFPVLMLAWILPIYERGKAAYERLLEIYEEPVEVKEGHFTDLTIPIGADIQFHHLSYSYPYSSALVLKDIDLTIKGGSFVGITGPIGAGKSTLLKLINRDYEVPHGVIRIGGRDIHDYPLKAFSEAMASVEQIPFLFSKSIGENVRFGNIEATQEELELVAQHVDLHETVLAFPEQYDTVIGERGVTLSGGQKQRVAIARAFLVDRSIILLDDIFSAVDIETEKRIFSAMRKRLKGKTVLLVTHRVSILKGMDRVIFLQDGKVVEDGIPKELEKREGPFAALSELQQWRKGAS